MVTRIVTLLLITSVCFSSSGLSSRPKDPQKHARTDERQVPYDIMRPAIDLIVCGEYDRAQSYIRKIGENSLTGQFLLASLYHARMGELESFEGKELFLASTECVIEKAHVLLKNDPGDVTARFFLGIVKGYQAVHYNRRKQYMKALLTGRSGTQELRRCIESGYDLPEARIAIGSYRYWKSAKNFLRILPGIPDKRKDAVREIQKNLHPGSASYPLGLHQLIWILLDYKQYKAAETAVREGLRQYPESRFFLYPAAITAQRLDKWEEAEQYFGKVAASLAFNRMQSRYMWVKVTVKQAECLFELKKYSDALHLCRSISLNDIYARDRIRYRSLLERAAQIENACSEKRKDSLK